MKRGVREKEDLGEVMEFHIVMGMVKGMDMDTIRDMDMADMVVRLSRRRKIEVVDIILAR